MSNAQKGKILVTGGGGYVGHNLIPLIKDRATVYDQLFYCDEYFEDTEFVRGDVTDHSHLKKYLNQVDTVVWLAGIVGDAACNVNPVKAMDVDIGAVQFLADNFDGKIIFMSSCSVYGRTKDVVDEGSPLNPLSIYAENKIKGEAILKGKKAYILRLGTLHGTSRRMRFDLVVNVLTMHAVVNQKIEVFGGDQYRPLLSVKDLSLLIKQLIDGDYEKGIYNVASENLSIIEIAKMIKEYLPKTKINILDSEFEDKRNYRVDISKAKKQFDFKPRYFVKDSIRDIAELVKSGRITNTLSAKYINHASLANSWRT